MVLEFRMRNDEIHGQLVFNRHVIHHGQWFCDGSVVSWLVNGNACNMFVEMLI